LRRRRILSHFLPDEDVLALRAAGEAVR